MLLNICRGRQNTMRSIKTIALYEFPINKIGCNHFWKICTLYRVQYTYLVYLMTFVPFLDRIELSSQTRCKYPFVTTTSNFLLDRYNFFERFHFSSKFDTQQIEFPIVLVLTSNLFYQKLFL